MMLESQEITFRRASRSDCPDIARLYSIASDGVADYVWSTLAAPGESIHDVGIKRYEREDTVYSYRNCQLATIGNVIAGMMVSYPMFKNPDAGNSTVDPVLLPYARLEEDNSFYISGMAVFEQYRGNGIGGHFLAMAESFARTRGFARLSLIVFEQNTGARVLYEKNGYKEAMREAVVPHPLIRYTGDALLMVKSLS